MAYATKMIGVLCNRCHGRMSFEYFTNMTESGGVWNYKGWRCVSCGEVVDPLILLNRINLERSVGVGHRSSSRKELFSARLKSVEA